MIATLQLNNGQTANVNLHEPLDISIPLRAGEDNPTAWYVDPVRMEPVKGEGFVGAVAQGGSVNFRNIYFNPHGHGTHTECYGHIAEEVHSVNQHLKQYFFLAQVVSVTPEVRGEDQVITKAHLANAWGTAHGQAIVIRTLPNRSEKQTQQWSNTNPPYLEAEATLWMRETGIDHLLIDLPSVDREVDGGALAAHRAFWNYPGPEVRKASTITEFIFVPDEIKDGQYLLSLQLAPFENDAAPSRPVLYGLKE